MLAVRQDEEDPSVAEAELVKLARQYRVAEGNRKAYTTESQNTIRKQQQQLAKLTKDNAEYKRQLKLLHSAKLDSAAAGDEVSQLLAQRQGYQEEIVEEMQRLKELQANIRALERELKERRAAIGGSQGQQAKSAAMDRKITTWQGRLEQANKKYSQQLAANGKLRETIDHLKAERKTFDSLHKRLDKELNDHKARMAEVIEASHASYEARDEAQSKIAVLKDKAEKERSTYTTEIKELNRFLAHDMKLKSFMGVKAQPRAQDEMSATQRLKAAQKKESPEEVMARYEAAFQKIKATTGIEQTSELVAKFIEGEDQVFSLFTYVNELNSDIETLQEQNQEIENKIRQFNEEGESVDVLRKTTLQSLEARLKTIEEQTATFEEKHSGVSAQMESLKGGVSKIFHDIGCDQSGLKDQLGNSDVSESNVMQFLGAIEQRSNELLQLQALLDHREKAEWESKEAALRDEMEDDTHFDPTATLGPKPAVGGLLGTGPKPMSDPLSIVPPSTGEELDALLEDGGEEEALRPLTHEEMKHKIVMGMSKRGKKPVDA